MSQLDSSQERWPYTFTHVISNGSVIRNPITKKSIKFDVESMRIAIDRYNSMQFKYGEYRIGKKPTLNYKRLIIGIKHLNLNNELTLMGSFVTLGNQFGLNLKTIIYTSDRQGTARPIAFVPRLIGNTLADGTMEVQEIVAIDVYLKPLLRKFILNNKNMFTDV
jgi:hypothetical protein